MQPRKRKAYAIWKRGVTLIAAFLVALLVLEVGVRLLVPQQLVAFHPGIWVPDETGLGHRLAPNVDTRINTGEREVRVLTDALGRRTGPASPPAAEKRVLALGDSFLEAFAVDYEDSLTGRMETLLSEAWGEPVRVLNTGVSGSGPNHYRLRAERELAREPVDALVVFLFLGNDVVKRRVDAYPARASALEREIVWPESLAWREIVASVVYPLYTELRLRSHLVVLLKSRLLGLFVRFGLSDHSFPSLLLRENAGSPRFELTADIAGEIAASAEKHGVPSLFVLLPADYQVDPSLGEAFAAGAGLAPETFDLDQSRRLMLALLRDRGLDVIDPTFALRAAAAEGRAPYGRVDRHLSAEGQDVVARAVARRLSVREPEPRALP